MKDNRLQVFLEPGSIPYRSNATDFAVDENSPFSDQYDWMQEEQIIKQIVDSKIEPSQDDEDRVKEYERRVNSLKIVLFRYLKDNKMISPRMSLKNVNLDHYIISSNPKSQGERPRLGKLVPVGMNGIYLHTGEATSLFKGIYTTNKGKGQGAVGCVQACAQIGNLYFNNRTDNPYVDQTMIFLDRTLVRLSQSLDQRINNIRRKMSESAASGFVFQEVESTKPKFFQVDFNNPYAIQYVKLVHKFDEYNRLLLAMLFQGAITRDQANKQRNEVQASIRTLFYETHVQVKFLLKDGFNSKLHYGNWLSADDAMINTLAQIAIAGYNTIDDDVLTRKVQPKFSLITQKAFSDEEVKKLLDVNKRIRQSIEVLSHGEVQDA